MSNDYLSLYEDLPPPPIPGYVYEPTEKFGIHTGRRRWRVICGRCDVEVHRATTSPAAVARAHDAAAHGRGYGGCYER